MRSPRCTHGIPPMYSWYPPDVLNTPRCTEHTLYKVVRRMRYLGVEIYKTLNDLNPGYMKDIFQVQQSAYSTRRPCNMKVSRVNRTTFGSRSILYEGAKIWNYLPNSLKLAGTLEIFTNLMKTWEDRNCKCNFCKYLALGYFSNRLKIK